MSSAKSRGTPSRKASRTKHIKKQITSKDVEEGGKDTKRDEDAAAEEEEAAAVEEEEQDVVNEVRSIMLQSYSRRSKASSSKSYISKLEVQLAEEKEVRIKMEKELEDLKNLNQAIFKKLGIRGHSA